MSVLNRGIESQNTLYTTKGNKNPLSSPCYEFKKIFRPEWFQGSREKDKYFEGWYFKNVSADEKSVWSFIPGISLVKGNPHSFVQAINGETGKTFYFRFPIDAFCFSSKEFAVYIGDNFFSKDRIHLNLNDGNQSFEGELTFSNMSTYPVLLQRPGIMGWYRYMPFMECYHGVVSLDHEINGKLQHNGTEINFNQGRGYIEKDYGSSMPKSWIWMQTNHFEQPGNSFMLSVARIPWIGQTFTGFLGYFLHNNRLLTFATYNGAKINSIEAGANDVKLTIAKGNTTIEIHALKSLKNNNRIGSGGLKAPVFGNMDRIIHESIDASINLTVSDSKKGVIFQGKGRCSGFEMVGDLELLKRK